jgi:uncharacterized membrane protein YfcA
MDISTLADSLSALLLSISVTAIAGGFLVGAIVGMTGVGGGSLMTPLLIGLMQVPPAIAVGTDLLFAALTKGFGSLSHWRYGQVDWRIVGQMVGSSFLASLATLVVLHVWLQDNDTGATAMAKAIRPALGVALLLTALAVLFRARMHAAAQRRPLFRDARSQRLATWVLGSIIGVLVTLSSVGAGAIGVTALLLIYPLLPIRTIVGTDIAYAVPLTLVAGAGHALLGHFDLLLLLSLLVGSLPGIWLGARMSTLLPERALRALLCGCLTFAGIKFLA